MDSGVVTASAPTWVGPSSDYVIASKRYVPIEAIRIAPRTVRTINRGTVDEQLRSYRDFGYTTTYGMISVCADPECPGAEDSFLLVDGAHRLTALRELHKEGHANAVGGVQVAVIVRRDGQPLTLMMALTLGVRANSTAAKAEEMSDVDNIHFITSWLREYNDRQPLGKKQSLFQHSMSDLIRIFYNYMDNRKQDPMDVDFAHRESDEGDREQEDQDDATARGGPETSRIGTAVLRRMIKIALIYI
ncbi:hypothetical protein I4F81_012691 [Pyropia yezoensis]|uniref:Uncharacterized protein n=1 Tax=Pyropia yezoensis TaxID=2788 RepID=A0ACC3CIW2_PYRYE|nr:hypothetical protein I4F81_012691 [Neopyropia yezoensis]